MEREVQVMSTVPNLVFFVQDFVLYRQVVQNQLLNDGLEVAVELVFFQLVFHFVVEVKVCVYH